MALFIWLQIGGQAMLDSKQLAEKLVGFPYIYWSSLKRPLSAKQFQTIHIALENCQRSCQSRLKGLFGRTRILVLKN